MLTGGSAKMEGMVDLAEEIFHMPVRLGVPQYVGGLKGVVQNPIFATGVGLVLYGAKSRSGSQYGAPPAFGGRREGIVRADEALVPGGIFDAQGRANAARGKDAESG